MLTTTFHVVNNRKGKGLLRRKEKKGEKGRSHSFVLSTLIASKWEKKNTKGKKRGKRELPASWIFLSLLF